MIEIFCAGYSKNDGKLTQMGGCGIVLISVDEYSRKQNRELSFGLAGSSQVLTEIQACRLALASILNSFRNNKVILYLESPEVASLITSGFTMVGFKNQIVELHKWIKFYKNLVVNVIAGGNENLDRARNLARKAADSQTHTDSLTIR